jgi:hypothetical protein
MFRGYQLATHPTILLGFPVLCSHLEPEKWSKHSLAHNVHGLVVVPPIFNHMFHLSKNQYNQLASIELVGFPMANPIEPSISSGCSLLFPAL